TGKEMFAQSIHYNGIRKDKTFIAQNCAAIPDSLLEGILFGTEKGGFTGAIEREGIFEQANGGTLLLDEINSMSLTLQAKLLRVLQEGYIRRVGGIKDIPIDVRIIATTNEN
ncbi:sigma-54 factor interaction domain-containing protein, partial [Vibrio parahaemolyticus]|nr:sigma-54 factor interaction domain-containing protein [Vibrio parahaemolyticus]